MIYQLCEFVITQALSAKDNPGQQQIAVSLVKACLRTLQSFLSWIPLNYIFDTQII
jgi:hypothetical protein